MWKEIELKKGVWEPVVEGDLLEGVVVDKEETKFGMVYHIETAETISKDEFIKTPQHKILQALMQNVEVGKRIRIIYKGSKDTGKGNPLEIYKLYVWGDNNEDK